MEHLMRVPLCDMTRQTEALMPELMGAVGRVLASGRYILGPEVEAFERDVAAYLGAAHAVGVASGTDALWLALKALGVRAGDKVLTTPFTFFATASAIVNAGGVPVFADIDPATFNLDPKSVREVLEGRSAVYRRLGLQPREIKAMVPVHLFGQPADMELLVALGREYKLGIVEDAAQALGATYGARKAATLGDVGCVSFFPTKNLGAFGDAGLVVTDDPERAERLRLLRAHGSKRKYHHQLVGANSRLDALQAAVLRVKLKHLDGWIAARQQHAAAYDKALQPLAGITPPHRAPARTHTFHLYTCRVTGGRRDRLQAVFQDAGIDATVYYPLPLHLQPALEAHGYRRGDFPAAEGASEEVLALPLFPELTPEERGYVVAKAGEFLNPGPTRTPRG